MNITIYVPNDLGIRVKGELGGRMSFIAQEAFRQELARRDEIRASYPAGTIELAQALQAELDGP